MDCEQVQEHLEAYALDWLDAAQRQEIDAHLEHCPTCRQALQEVEETLAMLPAALARRAPVEMPVTVRERVLAQIASEQAPAATAHTESSAPEAPAQRTGQSPGNRSRSARGYRLALALAMLLLAIAVLWGIRLNIVLARERALRVEFRELVDRQEVVLEVVDSSNTTRRVLLPPEREPDGEPGPYGKVFTRADMPYVVAMVGRLPEPPGDEVYYLWLTDEEGTRLAGPMRSNDEGFGLLIYEANVDGPEFAEARITRQPPGATSPSDPPILIWQSEEP